jgi:hypothetical protein
MSPEQAKGKDGRFTTVDRRADLVAASAEDAIIVITVYEPDPDQWEAGFERRKP